MTPDYDAICFVVMPFGKKSVGHLRCRWWQLRQRARIVDFDLIYDTVFEPAIGATPLPEGGFLVPKRTDREFVTGDIGHEMFRYLEYSRFTVADITGLNFNVGYELGQRHSTRESGTAIFRQVDAPIPFDISHINAFPYEYEPERQILRSRALITRVLTNSLVQNRLDSPIRIALRNQRDGHGDIERLLRDAEIAVRHEDRPTAIQCYRRAVTHDAKNALVRLRLGLLLKEQGSWTEALTHFDAAIAISPKYAEAYREKGIAENKLHMKTPDVFAATGEMALREAIRLQSDDFDALASLGGILKREGRYDEAFAIYQKSTEVSNGHPYPLLNEIALQARAEGRVPLDELRRSQLLRAERSLLAQIEPNPPYNAPWSFFDLAVIRYYLGDDDGLMKYIEAGLPSCNAAWQPQTFRDTLALLVTGGIDTPVLRGAIDRLSRASDGLPRDK